MTMLDFIFRENTLHQLLYALGGALLAAVVLLVVRQVLVGRLKALSQRTSVIWDDVLADVLSSTKLPFILWLSALVGTTQIRLPEKIASLPYKGMMILLIIQCGIWAARAVSSWVQLRMTSSRQLGDGAAITNFGVVAFILRLMVCVVTLLLLLDNLGVNITALVASLGIGGVAVALALQNVLGDLFASLSIAFDKPFVVGDFIVVDSFSGTVKNVGLKTTRVQSISGEEVVFANNDLLKSRVRNYKRMSERRIVFAFGVTYDTPTEALRALSAQVRQIIEATPGTRFDRAHFKGFGASSLDFEVVFFMLEPDFLGYMNAQESINLALLDYCKAQDIQFAFPSQTLYVDGLDKVLASRDAASASPPAAA